MKLLELNLKPLLPIIENKEYTDLLINKEGLISAKKTDGKYESKTSPQITRKYLQGLVRLLATRQNKIINDIDNFDGNFQLNIDGDIHRIFCEFGNMLGNGFSVFIRLKRNSKITLDDFLMSESQRKELISLVKNKENILISGGIGTGKTTFLNALLDFVEDKTQKHIVTIENVSEVNTSKFEFVTNFIYQNDEKQEVIKAINKSFRTSPDILIVGELRAENSEPFLRFLNNGHKGTMSTIHANSAEGAIDALTRNIISVHQNMTKAEITQEIKQYISCTVQLERSYKNHRPVVLVKEIKKY